MTRKLTMLMDAATAESPELRPLTKTFPAPQKAGWGAHARPIPRSFLGGRALNSAELEYASNLQLAQRIQEVASVGGCLSTGRCRQQLVAESRAGKIPQNQPTDLLVLDIDGMAPDTCNQLLADMGLGTTTHVRQFSASHGLPGKQGLRCHLFFLLATPQLPSNLKATLEYYNVTLPYLRDELRLSAHGLSLIYPLDITSVDSGRLIYVAPPILNGNPDPFAPGNACNPSITASQRSRIAVVERANELAVCPLKPAPSRNTIMQQVVRLRAAAGLPEHTAHPIRDGVHGYIMRSPDAHDDLYNFYRTSAGRKELCRFSLVVGERDPYYYAAFRPDIVRTFAEPGIGYYLNEMCPKHYYEEAVPYADALRSKMHPRMPPFIPR